MTNIIIQVDDKQELIDALQLALTEGEKFAKRCFDILVEDWGADKCRIDQIGLIEMGTGHLIDCCMKGISPTPYKELIADRLSACSDVGLAKMGLTRMQYEAKGG
jgi:hypothetical protein